MARDANLYLRVDSQVKKDAEELFNAFGINISDAVNIFLNKALMVGGFPFEVVKERYNKTTEAAIQEVNNMISGKVEAKDYCNLEDLKKNLKKE